MRGGRVAASAVALGMVSRGGGGDGDGDGSGDGYRVLLRGSTRIDSVMAALIEGGSVYGACLGVNIKRTSLGRSRYEQYDAVYAGRPGLDDKGGWSRCRCVSCEVSLKGSISGSDAGVYSSEA
ncbi:hypothetical protein Tco_0208462, partial [Tanacetum coccineum]